MGRLWYDTNSVFKKGTRTIMSLLMPTMTIAPELSVLDSISLYIHIPFCHTKCHYCDFNSYAGLLGWRGRYVKALVREITLVGEAAKNTDGSRRRCRTVFFGGGTPSLLSPNEVAALLAAVYAAFAVDENAEITLEANPGTLERVHLAELQATGLTRLSMGAQSFDAAILKWMGRIHSPSEIVSAVDIGRQAGFDNINLDFIFAVPGQTMDQWQSTLEQGIALAPDHLSLYSLIVEPTTPLFDWVEAGTVVPADEDIAADMYLLAQQIVGQAGYEQYEISNWARDHKWSDHNLTYWRNLPYIGVGAGAHSSYAGYRYSNIRPVEDYVAAMNTDWNPSLSGIGKIGGPIVESEITSRTAAMSETAILALRLNVGLDLDMFAERFGIEVEQVYGPRIADLFTWNVLEQVTEAGHRYLRLTESGRLIGNEAFERFLPNE